MRSNLWNFAIAGSAEPTLQSYWTANFDCGYLEPEQHSVQRSQKAQTLKSGRKRSCAYLRTIVFLTIDKLFSVKFTLSSQMMLNGNQNLGPSVNYNSAFRLYIFPFAYFLQASIQDWRTATQTLLIFHERAYNLNLKTDYFSGTFWIFKNASVRVNRWLQQEKMGWHPNIIFTPQKHTFTSGWGFNF